MVSFYLIFLILEWLTFEDQNCTRRRSRRKKYGKHISHILDEPAKCVQERVGSRFEVNIGGVGSESFRLFTFSMIHLVSSKVDTIRKIENSRCYHSKRTHTRTRSRSLWHRLPWVYGRSGRREPPRSCSAVGAPGWTLPSGSSVNPRRRRSCCRP